MATIDHLVNEVPEAGCNIEGIWSLEPFDEDIAVQPVPRQELRELPNRWWEMPGRVLTLTPSISAASRLSSAPWAALDMTASVNMVPFRAVRV